MRVKQMCSLQASRTSKIKSLSYSKFNKWAKWNNCHGCVHIEFFSEVKFVWVEPWVFTKKMNKCVCVCVLLLFNFHSQFAF